LRIKPGYNPLPENASLVPNPARANPGLVEDHAIVQTYCVNERNVSIVESKYPAN
jgi:hypothetical protein